MSKTLRHQRILDLVKAGRVSSQESLRALLERENFRVTQSTLSRDIKELELVKGAGGYRLPGENGTSASRQNLEKAISQNLLRCTAARNLVVVRTPAGHAHALAVAMDTTDLDGVLGTVAGDDTILLVTPDDESARQVAEFLMEVASRRR